MGARARIQVYDHFIYRYRSYVAFGATAVLAGLVWSAFSTITGVGWPATWPFLRPTLTDEVTAMLAVGTVALASAALVQAMSAERQRVTSLWPHLSVTVTNSVNRSLYLSGKTIPATVQGGPFTFELRNSGPGHAMETKATLRVWTETGGVGFPPPHGSILTSRQPDQSIEVVESHTMAPNDLLQLDAPGALSERGITVADGGTATPVAVQLVLDARTHAVVPEYRPQDALAGLVMTKTDLPYGGIPAAAWRVLTKTELEQIRKTLPA